jgi:uncharacterized protein YkwD
MENKISKQFPYLFLVSLLTLIFLLQTTLTAHGSTEIQLPDGTTLDFAYYKQQNPDVVQAVGEDPTALADHYWNHGIQEGRLPKEGAKDVSASTVISLVNDYRNKNGLSSLSVDPVLMQAAQARARELADNQFFSHTRPADGSSWVTILGDARSSYKTLGENLARKQTSASNVVYAWTTSDSHKAVMLNAKVTGIGVGVAKSTSGDFYFALMVGK